MINAKLAQVVTRSVLGGPECCGNTCRVAHPHARSPASPPRSGVGDRLRRLPPIAVRSGEGLL